jgi:predicted amidohydrolase YtcJ
VSAKHFEKEGMKPLIPVWLICCAVLAACERTAPEPAADIVLLNGGLYTVDAERSWAEAAAIRDGRIVMVGENASVDVLIGPATEVIDLDGRMAMPGIIDSHVHPLEGAYELVYCNLWDYESLESLLDALQECDANSDPDDAWFQAVGLDLSIFGVTGPDKSLLDGIAEGKFVFIDASDGHAALINDKTLDLLGFGPDTPDPRDGVIERRDNSREPNGTVRESARHAVDVIRPRRSIDTSVDVMKQAIQKMNAFGITGVVDTWVGEHEMQVYTTLDDAGDLSLYVLGSIIDEGVFEKHIGDDLERVIRDRSQYESERISYNSVKFMVDGVFEGETGAVLEPYHTTGHRGVLNRTPEDLRERVQHYYDMGMQLHFHTIGDRAVRTALDVLEHARANGDPALLEKRHALSHLGLTDAAEFPRFAEQNAAAAFTAIWAYPSQWTINLEIPAIGQERVDNMYRIRSIHEAGGVIVGSSDWNYGELDPLLSIETAVTRQDPYGPSELRATTHEAVDLATIIDAYTINGAWLMHREDDTGSIESGKLADMVIYDRNLFEIDAEAISETRVDMTIYNGRVVYRRD